MLWTILAVILLLAVVLPGFSRRPAGAGFFLSGRTAGSATVAASLAATCLGASTTVGMVGRAYDIGWPAFWWLGAGALGLALLGLVWGPEMRADPGVRTLPEWAETAYGAPARVLSAGLIAVMWIAVIAAQWVATATVMGALFGLPFAWGIALSAGVVSAYTAWGGQPSVLRTDRLQVLLILLAVLVPLPFLGGIEAGAGAGDFAATGPLQMVAVVVVVGGMYVVGPDLCSRVLLARDRTAVRRGALGAGLFLAATGVLLTAVGVAIRRSGVELANAREALPWLLAQSGAIPAPAGYLINAGLLAATLSSADTCLLTVASVLELDLCGRRHDEARQRRFGRIFVALAGGVAAWVAWQRPQIIPNLLLAYAFYSGGLLAPLLLLRFPAAARRIPRRAVWLAMAAGGRPAGLAARGRDGRGFGGGGTLGMPLLRLHPAGGRSGCRKESVMDLDSHRQRFAAYVETFATAEGLHPMQQLKLDHTWRVAANCREIAQGEGWSNAEASLAEAAGIWHDVARFEQYRRFRTFADPRSFDHGERGADLLAEHDLLDGTDPGDAACLVAAVRLHNRLSLPEDLPEGWRRIVQILRDADKLDILEVFVETFRTRSYEQFPEILLHVDPDGPLSEEVVAAVAAGRTASYAHIRSLVDMRLLSVGWLYDINFARTFALIRERGLFRGVRNELPDRPEVRAALDQAEVRFSLDFAAPPPGGGVLEGE